MQGIWNYRRALQQCWLLRQVNERQDYCYRRRYSNNYQPIPIPTNTGEYRLIPDTSISLTLSRPNSLHEHGDHGLSLRPLDCQNDTCLKHYIATSLTTMYIERATGVQNEHHNTGEFLARCMNPATTRATLDHLWVPIVVHITLTTHRTEIAYNTTQHASLSLVSDRLYTKTACIFSYSLSISFELKTWLFSKSFPP